MLPCVIFIHLISSRVFPRDVLGGWGGWLAGGPVWCTGRWDRRRKDALNAFPFGVLASCRHTFACVRAFDVFMRARVHACVHTGVRYRGQWRIHFGYATTHAMAPRATGDLDYGDRLACEQESERSVRPDGAW